PTRPVGFAILAGVLALIFWAWTDATLAPLERSHAALVVVALFVTGLYLQLPLSAEIQLHRLKRALRHLRKAGWDWEARFLIARDTPVLSEANERSTWRESLLQLRPRGAETSVCIELVIAQRRRRARFDQSLLLNVTASHLDGT